MDEGAPAARRQPEIQTLSHRVGARIADAQAIALLSLLPTALKALLMLLARVVIPATAARARTAATRAYSIRS